MADPVPVLMMVRALDLGGTERQLTEMARALAPARFQVHVGSFHTSGFRARELWKAGIPVVEFPVRSFARPGAIRGALAVGRYLNDHRIRLVHTFDVPLNMFGVPVARFFRTPAVVSSQRAFRDLTPGFQRQILRLTDRIVDAVVVNCRAVARDMIERDGTPRSLIHWCPNGIDTSVFYPAAPRPEGPPTELAGAALVIGCICALRPEKNLSLLLEAFRRVRALRPGLRLAIVGSGPELPALEERRRELGLEHDCLFVPATGEPASWYRAMDIFVLPSRSEALSNSLMEAMACGCAVAASNVGGNPELVTAGETGLLFEPGDAEDLTDAVRTLILDDTLRADFSAAAAARMAREFSVAASAERLASIYDSLLR
jgi:glycosyltransferase involved in cell wall biosynthesis